MPGPPTTGAPGRRGCHGSGRGPGSRGYGRGHQWRQAQRKGRHAVIDICRSGGAWLLPAEHDWHIALTWNMQKLALHWWESNSWIAFWIQWVDCKYVFWKFLIMKELCFLALRCNSFPTFNFYTSSTTKKVFSFCVLQKPIDLWQYWRCSIFNTLVRWIFNSSSNLMKDFNFSVINVNLKKI